MDRFLYISNNNVSTNKQKMKENKWHINFNFFLFNSSSSLIIDNTCCMQTYGKTIVIWFEIYKFFFVLFCFISVIITSTKSIEQTMEIQNNNNKKNIDYFQESINRINSNVVLYQHYYYWWLIIARLELFYWNRMVKLEECVCGGNENEFFFVLVLVLVYQTKLIFFSLI